MSKTTQNQKFHCLMQWLCELGKFKKEGHNYVSTKPKQIKLIEEIKLES